LANEVKRHPKAKLSVEQVQEIRRKFERYVYTMPMLAREYGVHRQTIAQILARHSWKEVD
jgi:ActR/RegA family two-component response regulator